MKILILGANGYIGNALLNYLHKEHELIAYDKVFTTEKLSNVKYITGDYLNVDSYSEAVEESDAIINFIGLSGAANSVRKTLLYNDVNIDAHLKFIDCLFSSTSKKTLIFPSSRLVYGKTGSNIVDENFPCCPLDFYGIQKLTIEQYLRIYANLHENISVVVLRITNPYGYYIQPEKTPGYNFINSLIYKILNGEEITIYGDGLQKRDYIFIDDVLSAIKLLFIHNQNYSVYNLGVGHSISIIDAIKQISSIIGKEPIIKFEKWPDLDFALETGDCFIKIDKLKSLGWAPEYDFSAGVKKILS